MAKTVQLTGVPAIASAGTVKASFRLNLAVNHLLSARVFRRGAGAIEIAREGQPLGEFWEELQAYAHGAVLTAVAGLEAYANELFVDRADVFPDLRLDVMAKLWELYEMKPTLEKFEFALLLRQGSPFDRGATSYQHVADLIKLRNALTHYKPEWSDEQVERAKISLLLHRKAVRCAFMPTSEPLFPRGWVSSGSARWAVSTVVNFILDFESRACVKSRIEPYVERLLDA